MTAVVEIAETDNEGNVTAVGLWAEPYKWYRVGKGGKGKELFELIGKTVKVTGKVRKDNVGERIITVLKYEVVGAEKR